MNRLIEKLDENSVPVYKDSRGSVKSFGQFLVKDLHIASMRPGAGRGNHSHLQVEVISVIDGKGICEIEVSDESSGETKIIIVEDNQETYKINAGIKHTVRNKGNRKIYLVCFLIDV